MKPGPAASASSDVRLPREIGGQALRRARAGSSRPPSLRARRPSPRWSRDRHARRRAAARRRSGRDRGRAGSSPAAIRFSISAATRAWKSAKMFIPSPRSKSRAPLTQVRRAVKKAGVLVDRETVGHSRDIIGDRARAPALLRLGRPVGRHGRRIGHIGAEQPPHDRVGLVAHPRHRRDGGTCGRTETP